MLNTLPTTELPHQLWLSFITIVSASPYKECPPVSIELSSPTKQFPGLEPHENNGIFSCKVGKLEPVVVPRRGSLTPELSLGAVWCSF